MTFLTSSSSSASRVRRGMGEIAVLGALFLFYKGIRLIAAHHVQRAFRDAWHLWDWERWLRLPSEVDLQQVLLEHHSLAQLANTYYVAVHFPVTIAVMAWCWWKREELYVRLRNSLVLMTATGLVLHVFVPVAPPRLIPSLGFVDIGARVGPSVYGPPDTDTLADQYAAVPSLHVGWALLVAGAMILALHSRWRWLWLLHPLLTMYVVVATGNHYWLDAVAAVGLIALSLAVLELVSRVRHRPPARGVHR